jgi:LysR family glycine cleavage system transcriptional activator
MAPRLGSFQVERPELAVRLKTETRLVDFVSEDVDVAIRSGRGGWPGLRQDFLFQFHSTPMCSPEFLERYPVERPEDVLKVPRLSAGDQWWKRWFAAAGVAEPEDNAGMGIWLDSQLMEGNAAIAGHGMAVLLPMFWKNELASGRLVAPFPIISLDGFAYWLVYPEHKRNLPKIRAFREWMLAQVAAEAANGPPEVFEPLTSA